MRVGITHAHAKDSPREASDVNSSLREVGHLAIFPKIVAIIMIASVMARAGILVNRARLIAAFQQYSLIGRALIANFVLVPVFAVFLTHFFDLRTEVAVGFLLMAAAPGVPFLPRAAGTEGGGSLSFGLALAFILSALSVIMIPITTILILPSDDAVHVPAARFLITLVLFQLVPLAGGRLIAERYPTAVPRLDKILKLVFFATALTLTVLLFELSVRSVTEAYGYGDILAIIILVLLSLLAGWSLGGPQRDYRRSLGIATALRNVGLCALIALDSFPETLVISTIMTYFIVQFFVTLPIRLYYSRTKNPPAPAA